MVPKDMHSDLTIPIYTDRLIIRPYRVDDADWYYTMSLKNKAHLARYESENPVRSIQTKDDAVKVIKDSVSLWDEQKIPVHGSISE